MRCSLQAHYIPNPELMEILKVCIDEIALCGLEGNALRHVIILIDEHHVIAIGCTFAELCEHVSRRQPPTAFPFDEQTKQFCWRRLLQSEAMVRLYRLPEPRKVADTLHPLGSSQGFEYVHPHAYRLVTDDKQDVRVRGSCVTHEQRKDVTEAVCKEGLSFSGAIEK